MVDGGVLVAPANLSREILKMSTPRAPRRRAALGIPSPPPSPSPGLPLLPLPTAREKDPFSGETLPNNPILPSQRDNYRRGEKGGGMCCSALHAIGFALASL